MEKVREKTLKKSLMLSVFITTLIVTVLSVITIAICYRMQKKILPDSSVATLNITTIYEDGTQQTISQKMEFGEATELSKFTSDDVELKSGVPIQQYSVDKIDYGIYSLTPHSRKIYHGLSILMVLLPILYAIAGIILCAAWFYKQKLQSPIQTLSFAANQIAQKDLDFTIASDEDNELGKLCRSFESMRKALYTNNKQLLSMLEDRRVLQASLAHDLRNPITMIQGYTEYIRQNIHNENITKDKISHMIANIETASKRLESYTHSIQNIYKMEDLAIERKAVPLPETLNEIMEDFILISDSHHIKMTYVHHMEPCEALLDVTVLYRVLENIIHNAFRYAKSAINIESTLENDDFIIIIKDDGKGFDETVLKEKNKYAFHFHSEDPHMGAGLIMSRILCQKHGGSFQYGNDENGGAVVECRFCIK